jgi:UDP-glucuronate 4-epimerase
LNILVTGAAGFIGYHLCNSLLNDGYDVLGIDNINNYYNKNLKLDRLEILNKYNNFNFKKIDISDRKAISHSFLNFRPIKVINLAAQAGVRYSLQNPYKYVKSNLIGFVNIIELCRQANVKGFIYASSSSVYGENNNPPFSVDDNVDSPISLYAATKKANELIAHSYSHLYGLHTTGLRYFTVYGPWGRPDMAYFKFTEKILKSHPINVFNNGKMKRDFTFIDDVISGTRSAIKKNYKCEIFNLGSSQNKGLMDLIKLIENELDREANINFKSMQPGDVLDTYADISKSKKKLNYNPKVSIEDGIPKFINWYKNYLTG